ncbi:MAG: ATP-grasp domain-containing protein [Candidatus Lokiarchaeota archaeon]|nr:ATP-grasp domain-containing protein [Candidatus Lokiarchaeota archaeon]
MKVPHSCKRDDWKDFPSVQKERYLLNKKIAIVGYTARSLNFVAKCAGLNTFVIDCFADMDLRRLADEFSQVDLDAIRDEKGELQHTAAYYLYQSILTNRERIENCDYLILGSSFENDFEIWERITKFKNYKGNLPKFAQNVRNPNLLFPYLMKNSIRFPKTIIFKIIQDEFHYTIHNPKGEVKDSPFTVKVNANEFLRIVAKCMNYPFVLKSANSGGGLGIYLIQNPGDFTNSLEILIKIRSPPYIIQEFINGIPMSCSFFANGNKVKIHTISQQIIGEHRFGCKGNFTYCGNIMNKTISDPNHPKNALITAELMNLALKLTQLAQLKGSNGIDFVLQNTNEDVRIYFIELNPRFQGTIDLVLACTGENLIQHHLKSIDQNILPNDAYLSDDKTYLRAIYYSPLDFHIMVDLQGLEFRDVPLIGSFIPNGAPLCSNIVKGNNVYDAFEKAMDDRDLMLRVLGLKNRIADTELIRTR